MKKILLAALLLFTTSISITKAQCLVGSYTIGGTTPNYTTITSAVAALNSNGVCGPVVFNIRSGIYTEQITIPAITGTSAVNTITFQSEALDSTSVTVQAAGNSTNNFVFRINGVDYIKFYKIKIKNTGTLFACILLFQTDSDNNTISNCFLESPSSSSLSNNKFQIISNSTNNENYTITNNYFKGGTRAISFTGVNTVLNSFLVSGNTFQNQFEYGIYIMQMNSPVITANTFNYTTALAESAIVLFFCKDSCIVANNRISLVGKDAIVISNSNGHSTKNILVSNNIINGSGDVSGISLNTTTKTLVYHNTVVLASTNDRNCCIYGQSTNLSNVVKNNIFYQKGIGKIFYMEMSATFASDYNNVYCTGAVFSSNNGTNYNTFISWKNNFNVEANSLNNVPQFVSTSDFHISTDFSQNLTLPYFPNVSKDFEGTTRDVSSPYFGAYELMNVPILNDASVNQIIDPTSKSCSGTQQVKVLLRNYGTNNLSSTSINWSVNGAMQTPFNWTGNLNFYDSTSVVIGGWPFSNLSSYVLKIWTSDPNGFLDGFVLNDTITSPFLYTRLNGVYTIGGASPNFTNFNAAINALLLRGVCGPVTFNIRSGTYYEQLNIPLIDGVSSTNKITFQSENGVNTSVTLNNNVANNSYTIYLNGSDYIEFKNLTITGANGNNNGNIMIRVENGSDNNLFFNNRIISTYFTCITSGSSNTTNNNYNKYLNNTIQGGIIGINLDGKASPTLYQKGNVISNNTFTNQTSCIIQGLNQDSVFVSSNNCTSAGTSPNAILFQYFNYIEFLKNKITVVKNAVSLTGMGPSSHGIIANNFINCSSNTIPVTGLGVGTDVLDIYNNSINISNTNPASQGIIFSASATANFKNNNIANTGGGVAVVFPVSILNGFSNRNNLYTSGAVLAKVGTTLYPTLTSLIAATAHDSNSVSVNPLFTSASNLHVLNNALSNAGSSVVGIITDDIDGDARNLSTPDIGADEFIPLALDASLVSFDNLSSIICAGTTPIKVNLFNNGTTTLTSASILWKVNGVIQTTNNWSGSLLSAGNTLVSLGNYNLLPGVNYTIKAWVINPNGVSDPLAANDTILKNNFKTALSGTYTIGGTLPDYSTFNTAVNDLIVRGVCGPVNFNVRNGTYNEQVSIPFITGSSAINTITFQSENSDSSTVILTFSGGNANNYVINFNNTSHIIVKKITVKSSNTSYGIVINFTGNNTAISFSNNILQGISTTSSSNLFSIIYSNSSTNKFITIANNIIKNGSNGVFLTGVSVTAPDSALVIHKNNFVNQFNSGVFIQYQESPVITSNILTSNSLGIWSGIVNIKCDNSIRISKNVIIALNGTGTSSSQGKGIVLNNCTSTSSAPSIVSNNMVSVTSDGISISSSAFQNIYYNSIKVTTSIGKCFSINGGININNINNIYLNYANGYGIWISGFSPLSSSDHNNIYTLGTNFGYISGTTYSNLAAWKTASGKDAASYSVIPAYYSSSDLHLNLDTTLNNKGISIATILDDIDGETRNSSNPDIGADEFRITGNDVAISQIIYPTNYCAGTGTLKIKIKNFGPDTLHSLTTNWKTNNVIQPFIPWTGTLNPGDSTLILLSSNFILHGGITNTIVATVSNPNGQSDLHFSDDNYTLISDTTTFNGTYTIGGTSPDYATVTEAVNALKIIGVCGPVVFSIRNGIYNEQFSIPLINGTSEINTITFQSENNDSSLVTIKYLANSQSTNYVVQLKNSRNIIFRKISLKALGTALCRVVSIEETCNNISFYNCVLETNPTTGFQHEKDIVYTSGQNPNSPTKNISFFNNRFLNGSNGIVLATVGAFSTGTKIINNYFSGHSAAGTSIVLERHDSCLVKGNLVFGSMNFASCKRVKVESNKILDGFLAFNPVIATPTEHAIVINNYIYSNYSNNHHSFFFGNYLDLYNNTFRHENAYNGATVEIHDTVALLKNNIFSNTAQGPAVTFGPWCNPVSDYNGYYSNGPDMADGVGHFPTLISLQNFMGQDAHSIQKLANFGAANDPHLYNDSIYNNRGTHLSQVGNDIDGDSRDFVHPDIGADEFMCNTCPHDDASFNYTSAEYCQSGINPTPVITGIAGGMFNALPAGIVIDSLTGTILLANSIANTYAISYHTAGPYPNSATVNITISSLSNAAFSYSGPYCSNENNPMPLFSGNATAGVFSSIPSGLSFVNTNTGEIDLSLTIPGTYTVTNTIATTGGCPLVAFNSTITVHPLPVLTLLPTSQTICSGSLVSGSMNSNLIGTTYTWVITQTGITGAIAGAGDSISQLLTTTGPAGGIAAYTILPVANGCNGASEQFIVTVDTNVSITVNSVSICLGQAAILTANGAASFTWSNGAISTGINTATASPSLTTSYTVIGTTSACSNSAVTIVTVDSCSVWPGDTDDDMVVNNNDLLPIGLYYSQAGSPRANISNSWQPYTAIDWGTVQTNGSDIKHVDSNGDGVIDNNDTLAINLNFSLTHALIANNFNEVRTGEPDIYFIIPSNFYNAGDWVNAEVWLGNSTLPVNNLYGIALNISYDASLVESGTESLTYPNSTWLGTPGTNAITVAKTDPLAATCYGGITRIDHINMNGFGKIANFKFQVKTNLQTPAAFHFSISNYKANDATGLPIVFAPSADSIIVYPLTTDVRSEGSIQEFTISPNPFITQTILTFRKEQKHTCIKIMDVFGKEIKTINFTGKQLIIEKAEMQKGIYFVQLIDGNNNVVNRKIIVQ